MLLTILTIVVVLFMLSVGFPDFMELALLVAALPFVFVWDVGKWLVKKTRRSECPCGQSLAHAARFCPRCGLARGGTRTPPMSDAEMRRRSAAWSELLTRNTTPRRYLAGTIDVEKVARDIIADDAKAALNR